MREISIANRHPRLRFAPGAVVRVIRTLDARAADIVGRGDRGAIALPPGELSLVFLTDAALARLHASFLDDSSITDVITFEGEPALGTAGEVCVSADAAARHVGLSAGVSPGSSDAPLRRGAGRPSRTAGTHPARVAPAGRRALKLEQEFSAELTLYLVHGWLHLAGHDDLDPLKKRAMRRAEARAMKLLARERCLPMFRLSAAS